MVGVIKGMRRWAALGVALALVVGVAGAGVSSAGAVAAPITAGGLRAQQPSVSGTRVVWADYRSGQWDVWLYDAAVKRARKITSGPGDKVQPAISGDTVVYVAFGDTTKGNIYAYDIPTGTTKALTTANGDQLNPVIGGGWVAWEDYSSNYNNTKVFAHNLTSGVTLQVAGSSSMQYRRPRIGGGTLVYERVYMGAARPELPQPYYQVPGQSDVLYVDLAATAATGPIYSAALVESTADERMASTDGTWIAWMQLSRDTGYDIKAKNLQTGQVVDVSSAPGEQALPIVGNGVVYWIDARKGVRINTMNLETGTTSAFPYRTRSDISGLAASGSALAWLQPESGRWVVKVLLGAPVPGVQFTALLPRTTLWSPFNFATLSTGGDTVSPKVTAASVDPGQTGVDGGQPLTVQFSEQMAPTSVNEQSVQLVDSATGATVPADVTYSTLTKTATVKPGQRLSGSYLLQVAPSVTDQAGNAAADSYAVSFATQGADLIAAAAPNQVGQVTAKIVSESGNVQLTWEAGSDPDGDLVGYQVKRFTAATLDPGTFSAAATLTPIAGPMTIVGTTATFAAASDELSRTSTYYYAVVGIDAAGNYSSVWYNISPNPHATEVNGMNTNSCLRCHSVHGATSGGLLGARGAGSCYKCHGSTDQASTVGTNSVNNIQGEFFDYPIASMTGTATEPSRHGNAYVRANADNMQCDMCHAPHKRSYNDSEPISYRKLLKRSQLASDTSSTTLYSSDFSAFGKELCYNCHGSGSAESSPAVSPYTNMYIYGGSSAFANTAGDHNQGAWDTVGTSGPAHGTQHVADVARPLALGGALPKNDCQVCHAEHGSESASLLAYRRSDTTTALASAGQLCFKCHSATAVAPDNRANRNAWNSRDVKAEFNRTGSTHPNTTGGTMQVPQESAGTPAIIDSATDFTNLTTSRSNIDLASIAGSAVLTKATVNPGTEDYLFLHDGGSMVFDQYRPADNAWNANNGGNFNPTDSGSFNTASGSQLFGVNGKIYLTRAAATSPQLNVFTPPSGTGAGTWATTALTFNSAFGIGSQATTANAGSSVVYITAGGATPSNIINWFNYSNNTENNMTFSGGTLGAGSAAAYAPGAVAGGRLFILFRNADATAGTGEGALWRLNAPAALTGAQTFTNTSLAITRSTISVSDTNRLVYFKDGAGVEYLMMIGLDTGAANDTVVVSALGNNTPTATNLNISPFGAALADGADIKWDGVNGGYIYATRGGANSTIARIKIPAANAQTAANWGTWSALTATPQTQDAGSGIAFAPADPPAYTSATDYSSAGTFLIDNATPAPGDTVWSRLSWVDQLPANTNVTVTVKNAAGTDIPGYTNISGESVDLSALSTATYPQLDFLVTLSTTNVLNTPQLDSMNLYSAKMVSQPAGSTTCYNCHNTHFVTEGTAGTAWQMGRVSDPQDTNLAYSSTSTAFCQRCHGATGYNSSTGAINIAAVNNSANLLIPYSIAMRPISSWPFFTSWNKSDFSSSGHFNATTHKALCETCHDPHGSNNKSLTAWTRPAAFGTGNAGTRDNTSTAAFESNLCFQCHGNSGITIGGFTGRTATGSGGVRMDIATAMNNTYKHDTSVSGKHSDDEGASGLASGNRHAECMDCHDPHRAQQVSSSPTHTPGSSVAGGALYGAVGLDPVWPATNWTTASSYARIRLMGAATDYESYLCFKCHTAYTTLPATSSNLALEFNPNNQAGHNVMGTDTTWPKTTTGQGLNYNFAFPSDATAFTGGKSATYKLTCSECHTNSNAAQARGPHGSGVYSLLRSGSGATAWYTTTLGTWTSAQNVCSNCHQQGSNNVHSNGNHTSYTCDRCHVKIPHGWKRPRMLIRYGIDNPGGTSTSYVTGTSGSLVGFRQTSGGATTWVEGECNAGCYNGHGLASGSQYP